MFVYIARHGLAGQRGDPRWPDDSLRELTPEGAKRFEKVVEALADRGFAPTRIATSPYARCRQTAETISARLPGEVTVEDVDALAPGSDLEELLDWTNAEPGVDVCWVGHSPDVERLAAALIGDGGARIRFAKGAIAAVRFEDGVNAGGGELAWLVTAKTLGV